MDSNSLCNRKCLFLEGLSPRAGALLATAIAEALADGFDPGQINVLGTFITVIGDSLAFIAAQAEHNSEICSKSRDQSSSKSSNQGGTFQLTIKPQDSKQ